MSEALVPKDSTPTSDGPSSEELNTADPDNMGKADNIDKPSQRSKQKSERPANNVPATPG
jgi:hypothetical protein